RDAAVVWAAKAPRRSRSRPPLRQRLRGPGGAPRPTTAERTPARVPALRILVADDHEVVRRGVTALLEGQAGWSVCAEAAGGREALEKAQQFTPDVAILDIGMPELNGLDVTRQLRKELPECEVLILTMHESEQVVREVLDAGARGYVLKSDAGR